MSTPFMGEIKVISFGFAPSGWAFCNGQLLPINQNQALFSLLGTTYGGNGQTNFALPDLRGRVPMHMSAGYTQGERFGEEAHTVSAAEMPTHVHQMRATTAAATGTTPGPTVMLARSTAAELYGPVANATAMDPRAVTNVGGSQPHNNMQPYLVLNFVIALQGIFPSRN
jgi:microcystin-dependent protein